MQELTIEEYIGRELSLEEQYVAKDFICYLKEKKLVFLKTMVEKRVKEIQCKI